MSEYILLPQAPNIDDYIRLRDITGLSAKSPAAAKAGLAGTWFGVSVVADEAIAGMGRVIGDGGCFFQVVDIAVDPAHQRRGLGRRIMQALMERLRDKAPATAHVTLLADGEAHQLYSQFGFRPSAPRSVGMIQRL